MRYVLAAALWICTAAPAFAQSSPGWFVPSQPAAPAPVARPVARTRPVAVPQPMPVPVAGGDPGQGDVPPRIAANLPQPPIPSLPDIAKVKPPPAPVIGVLSVPDVEQQSSAAQAVTRVIGERKEKLHLEVERAQANWRALGQQFQAEVQRMTPQAAQNRETVLRNQVNGERRRLQNEERVIAEAAQIAAGQIERTLVNIIRQVAEAHGMNLVLHRSQVALNEQYLDITDDVVRQLNRVLPTVQIPPADVDPEKLPKDWGTQLSSTR